MKQHHFIFLIMIALVAYFLFIRKLKVPVRKYTLTSKFGNRVHPITGVLTGHNGIDLASPTGTPVYAPAFGIVADTNTTNAGGNQVFIKHLNGLRTGYSHLNKWHIKKGEIVYPGQHIADVGNTGQSTGPHLHFTVKKNGQYVDPLDWMKIKKYTIFGSN